MKIFAYFNLKKFHLGGIGLEIILFLFLIFSIFISFNLIKKAKFIDYKFSSSNLIRTDEKIFWLFIIYTIFYLILLLNNLTSKISAIIFFSTFVPTTLFIYFKKLVKDWNLRYTQQNRSSKKSSLLGISSYLIRQNIFEGLNPE